MTKASILSFICFVLAGLAQAAAPYRIAAFQADMTPQTGEPLIWTIPTTSAKDKMWAKGVVIDDGRARYVLCAIDWCGIANRTHQAFRKKLAKAARTDVSRVAVQTVHQHTAPYVNGDAYDLLRQRKATVREFSDQSIEVLAQRAADALEASMRSMQPFDRVGTGQSRVERVASARRLMSFSGQAITRYSVSGKDPAMAAAPEGAIDPVLRTVTFAQGSKPLVRLHYYATHPQTWCCDGKASADAIGAARQRLEQEAGVPQIYFTGCGGDVTVGKYNDGSDQARNQIEQNLFKGLKAASAETKWYPAEALRWRSLPLRLPKALDSEQEMQAKLATINNDVTDIVRYRAAMDVIFARRQQPLDISLLTIGPVRIVHLPGEPMLEFQRFAQSLQPDNFVAVAGYGDISPGYICTDKAYEEGGYEPSASHTAPGAEGALKAALRKLLEE